MRLVHGSVELVTMPPSGICNFFLHWRSILHPRAHRKRRFPTPELLIDLIRFLLHLFILAKAKRHVFTFFMNVFLSLMREG